MDILFKSVHYRTSLCIYEQLKYMRWVSNSLLISDLISVLGFGINFASKALLKCAKLVTFIA